VGTAMRLLSRWAREFAAGVDAGHAIRLGLPVPGLAVRDGVVRDTAKRHGCRRIPTTRGGA
jgi:hypothetical protein